MAVASDSKEISKEVDTQPSTAAEFRFRAADAFAYVDTYRRHILYPAPRVQADVDQAHERLLDPQAGLSPTRLYAELRALEHALAFVTKREEPGLVVLGESSEDLAPTGNGAGKTAKQLAQELRVCEDHSETLETSLKQYKQREQEIGAELQAREQQIVRLKLRMESAQSAITVLSATLVVSVLIVVLILML